MTSVLSDQGAVVLILLSLHTRGLTTKLTGACRKSLLDLTVGLKSS